MIGTCNDGVCYRDSHVCHLFWRVLVSRLFWCLFSLFFLLSFNAIEIA